MYEYVDFCLYASSSIFMPILLFSLADLSSSFVCFRRRRIRVNITMVCCLRFTLQFASQRCRASSAPVVLIFQLVDGQRVGKILTLVIASPFVSPRPLFEPTRHYRSKNNMPFRHHFEKGPQLTPAGQRPHSGWHFSKKIITLIAGIRRRKKFLDQEIRPF